MLNRAVELLRTDHLNRRPSEPGDHLRRTAPRVPRCARHVGCHAAAHCDHPGSTGCRCPGRCDAGCLRPWSTAPRVHRRGHRCAARHGSRWTRSVVGQRRGSPRADRDVTPNRRAALPLAAGLDHLALRTCCLRLPWCCHPRDATVLAVRRPVRADPLPSDRWTTGMCASHHPRHRHRAHVRIHPPGSGHRCAAGPVQHHHQPDAVRSTRRRACRPSPVQHRRPRSAVRSTRRPARHPSPVPAGMPTAARRRPVSRSACRAPTCCHDCCIRRDDRYRAPGRSRPTGRLRPDVAAPRTYCVRHASCHPCPDPHQDVRTSSSGFRALRHRLEIRHRCAHPCREGRRCDRSRAHPASRGHRLGPRDRHADPDRVPGRQPNVPDWSPVQVCPCGCRGCKTPPWLSLLTTTGVFKCPATS